MVTKVARKWPQNKYNSANLDLYIVHSFVLSDPTQDHTSDDHDEEREDTKLLLNFCDVQLQLIQTHNSILELYKEEQGSGVEPWQGKSKELVGSLISLVEHITVYGAFWSHTPGLGCSKAG